MGLTRAAVIFGYPPRYVFIPMFIIFAAACLLLAGCSNDDFVSPVDCGDDCIDEPVCTDSLPSVEILLPPHDAPLAYPLKVPFTLRIERHTAVAGMRYLLADISLQEDALAMLNEQPEAFEDLWSEWIAPEGEYSAIVVGENETLHRTHIYLFAVQVMDSCGRADSLFTFEKNARQFRADERYPTLFIASRMLGSASVRRLYFHTEPERVFEVQVPPGVPLAFEWWAPPPFDWMVPVEYRYGWDIQNLGDDEEWDCYWSPLARRSSERTYNSGVHVLYIEARDAAGAVTRARIEIEIEQFQMDRDILWVDDWRLGDYMPNRMLPSEAEHDEFWTRICSRAPGFDPLTDIYSADELYSTLGDDPLPLEVLSRYRHVIWTYSSSVENAWKNTIAFRPEPYPVNTGFRPNTLALYLAGGGSVLTCGRADQNNSALGSTFNDFYENPDMPASILDDYGSLDYPGDYPGRHSMAWADYYVTVVDKVLGPFRIDLGVTRRLEMDAMRMAIEASGVSNLDIPDTLMLDESVSCYNCFFDPRDRGFFYVEVYDPSYYMSQRGLSSHDCFSPLYRMRARNTRSPLDHAAVALKVMRPECENSGNIIYDSYHFGFPLWFFEHEKVEQMMDEIFRTWEIR